MTALALALAFALASAPPDATAPPAGLEEAATARLCEDSLDDALFNSPRRPAAGEPLRVIGVTSRPAPAVLAIALYREGERVQLEAASETGSPPWAIGTLDAPREGTYRALLVVDGAPVACQDIEVSRRPRRPGRLRPGQDPVWESRVRWERDTENLYSAWIAHMFRAARGEELSWRRLADVVRDPARNFLFNHLGLKEDKDGLGLDPDCADFPYTLRAYFAWKIGLPMAIRQCRRGNAERAPTCSAEFETNAMTSEHADRPAAFRQFYRRLKSVVHSSSPRTAPDDETSDVYPVALSREALRPGTIYADPYGHTMVISAWYPQTDTEPGLLMTVDAQPDETVGQRVFWRGNFLFPDADAVKGAGWKRFRPVRIERGEAVVWSDARIEAATADYGDLSDEQWRGGSEAFHTRMDALISPAPMRLEVAIEALIGALEQQVLRRVESIDTAETWFRENPGKVIPMPEGSGIFLTSGPWEDLSTPSRDMRLLIAIDVIRDLPRRVAAEPERFIRRGDEAPEAFLAAHLGARTFNYRRSDGTSQTLTLGDVVARAPALEMGWNPNDCPEHRWGAADGSPESSTCKRRAPVAQTRRMEEGMRQWFARRARPLQH